MLSQDFESLVVFVSYLTEDAGSSGCSSLSLQPRTSPVRNQEVHLEPPPELRGLLHLQGEHQCL